MIIKSVCLLACYGYEAKDKQAVETPEQKLNRHRLLIKQLFQAGLFDILIESEVKNKQSAETENSAKNAKNEPLLENPISTQTDLNQLLNLLTIFKQMASANCKNALY